MDILKLIEKAFNRASNVVVVQKLNETLSNKLIIDNFRKSLLKLKQKIKIESQSEEKIRNYFDELGKFLDFTENETKINTYKIPLGDILKSFIEKLEDNERITISKEEFSRRYDELVNQLGNNLKESNLSLFTIENREFKIFKNNNSIVIRPESDNNNLSTSKDNLIKIAYGEKENNLKAYTTIIIEKLMDNTIFDEIKNNDFIEQLRNIGTENERIKKLEDEKNKLFVEVKNLEEKFKTIEQTKNDIEKLHNKAINAEQDFKNAEEAIKSKIETNKSKSFWENQVKFFDEKYKWYLWTTIITTVIFIILLAIYKYVYFSSIINTKSSDLGIKEIIAYGFIILLISLAIWIIRIFMKIALSSYHLSIDAKERVTMINTYIALMQEGNTIKDDDKHIMIESIFRQTNHGIIKDESSVTVTDIISSFKK